MVNKVQILKTPGCSSCAQATKLVKKIKKESKLTFVIEEVDIIKHPDLLQKYKIMTSPSIVVDGKLEFEGLPTEKKLKEKLVS